MRWETLAWGWSGVGAAALALLGACPTRAPSSRAAPVAMLAAAAGAPSVDITDSGGAPTEPPFADVAPRPALTAVLSKVSWSFGFEILGAPKGMKAPVVRTRGGYEDLNRVAAELESLAEACRCTSEPLPLLVADDLEGSFLWSVLGMIEQVGFLRVAVTHRGQTLPLDLELSQPTPDPKRDVAFRLLPDGIRALGTPLTSPPIDVAELCSNRSCAGASLLLSQGTPLDVGWRAAQAVAAANGGRVALRLDSLPRQPQPKPGKMSTMLALLSVREIEDRARLEYGSLYACLTKFPVLPDVPRRAFFSMNVNPDGMPSAVKLHALVGDAPPPLRSPHPPLTPTTECLRQAFGQMAFSAPHYGKVAPMLFGFHLKR